MIRLDRASRALLVSVLVLTAGCALFRPPPRSSLGPTSSQRLEKAEGLVARAELGPAADELQSLLDEYPSSPEAPRALYQLALIYLAPDSPLHDGKQGITLLRNLIDSYPGSAWTLASETILELAATNADLRRVAERLQEQLDQLRRIDIGSDG